MLPIKKRVGEDGQITIDEALKAAKIQPGDWVEVTPDNNRIIIKVTKQAPKGSIRTAAGILKDNEALVEEMLRIREEEDDRPSTSLQ